MTAKSTRRAIKVKAAEVKEAPAPKPKPASHVTFESRGDETHEIVIMGMRSGRVDGARLQWSVPADKADRFAKHHHVVSGRVVRRG